jgi:DNA-binding IscR family transcriptional regulator
VLANCFTQDAYCGHSDRCTVKRPLKRIHDSILRLLDSVSIQDMLQDVEEPKAPVARPSPLVALQLGANSSESQGSLRK